MTPVNYVSIPGTARGLTWPGASQADLEALVGAENVNASGTAVQVRNQDGEWFTLGDGWVVAVTGSGKRHLLTSGALAATYTPAAP